jgi:hypothetical protein
MDTTVIKKLIKDGYEQLGFDVISETEQGATLLRYPEPGALDVTLHLAQEDIEEYAQFYRIRQQFSAQPNAVSMLGRNFREQLLNVPDTIHPEDFEHILPSPTGTNVYVEIGQASPVFCNFMRFEAGYSKLCIDRLFDLPKRIRQASTKQPLDLRAIFARPLTIRVFQLQASSFVEAQTISDEWIDRTLFALGYEFNMAVSPATNWQTARLDHLQQIRSKDHRASQIFSSDIRFRPDLVRLYQAGIAASVPSHQFLAWFQILEMFFQEVDHAGVYDRLSALLSEPDFAAQPAHLARIVNIVESTRKEATPHLRLTQLIRQHVPGEDAETVAARLLRLYDAIIEAGTLPVSMESVSKELPLIRQLAEAVILATRVD